MSLHADRGRVRLHVRRGRGGRGHGHGRQRARRIAAPVRPAGVVRRRHSRSADRERRARSRRAFHTRSCPSTSSASYPSRPWRSGRPHPCPAHTLVGFADADVGAVGGSRERTPRYRRACRVAAAVRPAGVVRRVETAGERLIVSGDPGPDERSTRSSPSTSSASYPSRPWRSGRPYPCSRTRLSGSPPPMMAQRSPD